MFTLNLEVGVSLSSMYSFLSLSFGPAGKFCFISHQTYCITSFFSGAYSSGGRDVDLQMFVVMLSPMRVLFLRVETGPWLVVLCGKVDSAFSCICVCSCLLLWLFVSLGVVDIFMLRTHLWQWFPTFLMLQPFNTVPNVVLTLNHKVISLLPHNCDFTTLVNCNVCKKSDL